MKPKTILFLCTGNSCRSQMAEGFARALLPKNWQIHSAGVNADGMNKNTIQVMAEAGIDISNQWSKTIDDIRDIKPDIVITLCDNAKESCPVFSGVHIKEHWGLPDPANASGDSEEILRVYREVRGLIHDRILKYFAKDIDK